MNITDYPHFVSRLCKSGATIRSEITADDCHLLHMVVGISGEAGELLDAVKKSVIYRKPLDVANVREELGDLLFYIQGVCNAIGANMPELIAENMDKLQLRYQSQHYSDGQAQARADKAQGKAQGEAQARADKAQGKAQGEAQALPDPEDFIENDRIVSQCNLGEECESCQ